TVEPGPLVVEIRSGVADSRPKLVVVPIGVEEITLQDLLESAYVYEPPVVSLVKQYRDEILDIVATPGPQGEPGEKGEPGDPGGVTSLDGLTGELTKEHIGLDRIDNTPDLDKPLSRPTRTFVEESIARHDETITTNLNSALADKLDESAVHAIASAAAAAIVDNAPEALDTLVELAAALGNNPNFATDVLELIGAKAPKEHTHDASGIITGHLPVPRGGTGRTTNTPGSFLVGNGTEPCQLLTPDQTRTAIDAAPAEHRHYMNDIDGLIEAFNSLEELFNAKVGAYPGQKIITWIGTQAAYDALPTSEKTAVGFIGAIY
ncbi:hypothetical protein, partial [Rhodococcus sp. BH5]|uniref:hypothetical protein n=1 Tax=Rhodococcus sp. BH5 TaxID=2871702 RepID=UPI0022CD997B